MPVLGGEEAERARMWMTEKSACGRVEAEPADGEDARQVAVRDDGDVALVQQRTDKDCFVLQVAFGKAVYRGCSRARSEGFNVGMRNALWGRQGGVDWRMSCRRKPPWDRTEGTTSPVCSPATGRSGGDGTMLLWMRQARSSLPWIATTVQPQMS